MKKFRALLVGAGSMGQTWAKNLAACKQVQTVGWVDIRPRAAAQQIENHKLAGVAPFEEIDKALSQTQPDFVVDVTVPEAHNAVTLSALKAGVPVLGEKPMADSMAHARAMVAAAQRAGLLYMVSQSRRYDARLHALRQLVIKHVGTPGIVNTDFFIGAHFGGFRDEMKNVLLLDMSIHTLDAARYVSGADALSVYCEEFNPPWSWYKHDSSAVAIFEMTGGLRYTYRGSWCSEGRHTSWEADWRVVGPKGTATWDGNGPPVADQVIGKEGFIHKTRPHIAKLPKNYHGGIAGSLRDFLHALETGATPMGECHDNIKSLAMVFAAIESAGNGKRVAVRI